MAVSLAQNGDLNQRFLRTASRCGFAGVIVPVIRAARRVGLGEPVSERRAGGWKGRLQPLDVADWPRCTAASDVLERRQVIFVAVGVIHQFQAHRRDADEIRNLLLFDQAQRFARVPFRHQHHATADNEAVEHHRDLPGDMEQRHSEQGPRLRLGRASVLGEDAEQNHQPGRIGIGAGGDRTVRRKRTLGVAGRARREQDRRIVVRRHNWQWRSAGRGPEQLGQSDLDRLFDRHGEDRPIGTFRLDPFGPGRVGDDQLRIGQGQRMLHLMRFPPAVEQGRDRAGFDDPHVGDDPRRAIAHREPTRSPLAIPRATRPWASDSEIRSRSAKLSRSSPATTASESG